MPENRYDESFFENFEKMYASDKTRENKPREVRPPVRKNIKKRPKNRLNAKGILFVAAAVILVAVLVAVSVPSFKKEE